MLVLSLALMIIVIDTTILNVSLRNIVEDLHTDLQGLQWVISAYALTLAALTITGGRLGDLFGRKKMFVLGAIIFAVGSFVTSISNSVGMMIIGESVIEGVGAALMMPATASLLVSTYRGRDRAIAFGIWGGVAAASSALGPLVGGFLTTHFSWRWAFRINIFVAAILLLGSLVINESIDREEKRQLDFLGAFLSASGLLALVYGLIEASTYGWWTALKPFTLSGQPLPLAGLSITPVAIIFGLLMLLIFVWWQKSLERRGHTPLVSTRLFVNGQFTSGVAVVTLLSLGMVGLIFAVPVFLQSVRNMSAFDTGLALLPMSLTMLISALGSAYLSKFITPKRLIQTGLLLSIIASALLHYLIVPSATAAHLAPGLLLFGAGMGLVMAPVSNLTLSAVSVEQAGEASGVNSTMRQVGSSFGSALIGAVLLSVLATGLMRGIADSKVLPESLKPQITQVITANASSVELNGPSKDIARLPDTTKQEVERIIHESSSKGSSVSILFTGAAASVGFLASFLLPNRKNLERNEPAIGH